MAYALIDTQTGELKQQSTRISQRSYAPHKNAAWVPVVQKPQDEQGTAQPGQTYERHNRAEPMPFDETATEWRVGWQVTGTPTPAPPPPTLGEVKASAKKRVDAWKKAKQDEPFTHSDTKQYDNTERDRINLNGAVQLAVLESLTNRPGPPTPPMAYKAVATDGTVTVMDKDAVTALGLSALAHMQSIQDQALQAHTDIDGALTDDEVLAIVDQLTAAEEPV